MSLDSKAWLDAGADDVRQYDMDGEQLVASHTKLERRHIRRELSTETLTLPFDADFSGGFADRWWPASRSHSGLMAWYPPTASRPRSSCDDW